MRTLLIKSGTIITASDTFEGDILIEGEHISSIGQNLFTAQDAEIVDARGKLVLPGGIDVHTHFDLPMFDTVSSDDHYTGHKAAAFGGTTTVIDFVPQDSENLDRDIEIWHSKVDPKAAVDFGFHMNITKFNEQVRAQISRLPERGVTTLKFFMAYNGRLRLQDGEIYQAMLVAKDHGLLSMLHAENGDVIDFLVNGALNKGHTSPEWHAHTRPAWGAVEAALRGAALAAQAEVPLYLVHMNTAGEVDMLEYVRQRGLPIMGETCPQYLFFTIDHLRRPDGSKWVCSPPMRDREDNQRLWDGLTQGIIQTIGTDHCPFFYDGTKAIQYESQSTAIPGKELGKDDFTKIPNGLPGVGDRLPVMWTYGVRSGKISPNQFVALNCTNPAKIFGLYPRKGVLLPGADADIVIWDPNRTLTYGVKFSHQRTDHNLYEGWELIGFPEKVFLRGNLLVDGDRWYGRQGMGEYLYRSTSAVVI